MSMQLEVTVTGGSELMAKLAALDGALSNFRKPLQQVGTDLKKYYSETAWASMGGAFGDTWPPLAPSTMKYKDKHYHTYANVPLMRTGAMKKGFSYRSNPLSVVIGNTVPYFKYHQSTEPRSKIPRREMIGINKTVKGMVQKRFYDHINAALGTI